MNIINVKDAEIAQTPHGVDVRPLIDFEHAQVTHIRFEPGEGLKPHITPVDATFFIIEGEPTVQVGDEFQVVKENSAILSPKNIVHNIKNDSDKVARVLVIKTPKQTTSSRVL